MAHNTRIKPQATDTVGLTGAYARIGTDIKNCVVVAANFALQQDNLTFDAVYLWNGAAADAWLANPSSVMPVRLDSQMQVGSVDLDKSIIDQCLDHLLLQPQFNGSQGNGAMAWVKSA